MGKVVMSGIVPKQSTPVPPVKGISARDLAVGNSVFLNVNGVKTEFLVVNHGIPGGSSLYDASCDGVWLLMKDIYEKRNWDSVKDGKYGTSYIHSYLNSTFLASLDAAVQETIKEVKIPWSYWKDVEYTSETKYTGGDGLSAKVFLMSYREAGWKSTYNSGAGHDGAILSYFDGTATGADSKRIAYLSGVATTYCLRTSSDIASYGSTSRDNIIVIDETGAASSYGIPTSQYGIRPMLILPHDALIDEETMMVKGAA